MLIKYANGRVQQGIVLALDAHAVRVALKDADDAAEFRLHGDAWVSEDCEVVTFEFPLPAAPVEEDDPRMLRASAIETDCANCSFDRPPETCDRSERAQAPASRIM